MRPVVWAVGPAAVGCAEEEERKRERRVVRAGMAMVVDCGGWFCFGSVEAGGEV